MRNNKIKRITIFLLVLILSLTVSQTVLADTTSFTYNDNESDVFFTVPQNWTQKELSEQRAYIDVKFVADDNSGMSIIYGSTDMWSQMPESDKSGYVRSDVNNSMLTQNDVAEMFGTTIENVQMVTYNNVEYYRVERVVSQTVSSINVTFDMTILCLIDNGWMYQYQFSGDETNEQYNDFLSLVESVTYPQTEIETSSQSTNYNYTYNSNDFSYEDEMSALWASVIISLIMTILVYTVPILIYRYSIKKTPISPKKARKITIIYAIIGFVIITIISFALGGEAATGGGIILWSFVNYKILTAGYSEEDIKIHSDNTEMIIDDTQLTIEETQKLIPKENIEQPKINTSQILFCRKCGARLTEDSIFCNKCGTKIKNEGEI